LIILPHFPSWKDEGHEFLSWSLKVFTWNMLRKNGIFRMDKSLNLAFWMTSYVSVAQILPHFPSWKDEGHGFLSMEFKSFIWSILRE